MSKICSIYYSSVVSMSICQKRRKLDPERSFILTRLPSELIDDVLSYISIPDCMNILCIIPKESFLWKMVYRSIYGRTVVLKNDSMVDFSQSNCVETCKFVDNAEIKEIVKNENEFIIPKRFVFSYTYSHGDYDYDKEYLEFFLDLFTKSNRYFHYSENFELYMDFFNQTRGGIEGEDFGIVCLTKLLDSSMLDNNLANLKITRSHRMTDVDIELLVASKLHKYKNLESLTLNSDNICSLEKFKWPDSLKYLNLVNNKLTSLPRDKQFLPDGLLILNLSCNDLTSITSVQFPDSIEYLDLQLNSITKISDAKLPFSLKFLNLSGNDIIIESSDRVKFPDNLKILNLLQNDYINENIKSLKFPQTLLRLYLDSRLSSYNFQLKKNSDQLTDNENDNEINDIIIYA